MKKMMLGILFSSIISFIGYGQNVKSDPTFSSSNYKHYNKAVKAEKFELLNDRKSKGTLATREVDQNYKAQNDKPEESMVVVLLNNYGNRSTINRNYKQQFKPTGESIERTNSEK